MSFTRPEIMEFLATQIAQAQSELDARVESAKVWTDGTDKEWTYACAIDPKTRGNVPPKSERLQIAEVQKRIAVKCRRKLEMLKAVLALCEQPPP